MKDIDNFNLFSALSHITLINEGGYLWFATHCPRQRQDMYTTVTHQNKGWQYKSALYNNGDTSSGSDNWH